MYSKETFQRYRTTKERERQEYRTHELPFERSTKRSAAKQRRTRANSVYLIKEWKCGSGGPNRGKLARDVKHTCAHRKFVMNNSVWLV